MRYRYTASIFIIISVILMTTITVITPDKEVSILEGRTLEILPLPEFIRNKIFGNNKVEESVENSKVNVQQEDNNKVVLVNSTSSNDIKTESATQVYIRQILNGEYFQRWDTYFSDHIVGRDYIVSSYMNIQDLKNSKFINGVYIGEDGMLFSSDSLECNNEQIQKSINKFNEFAKEIDVESIFLGVIPSKDMIEKENFPINKNDESKEEIISNFQDGLDKESIKVIKFDNLSDQDNVFYKTDHHLNSKGIYLAYKDVVEAINSKFEIGKPLNEDMFNIETFENCYIGADGRKVGYLVKELDDITVYSPKDINYKAYDSEVEYNLIDKSQISKDRFNNDYLVFMGGDKSRVIIENEDSENDLRILTIGDSMDNPIIPMLVPHFKSIYSFDLRYNNIDIIKEINDIKPDIVLLLGLPGGYLKEDSKIFRLN